MSGVGDDGTTVSALESCLWTSDDRPLYSQIQL